MKKEKNGGVCHKWRERLLSVLLSLSVVMMLMPIMPIWEVRAEAEPESTKAMDVLKPTVENGLVTAAKVLHFAGKDWYVIGCNGKGILPASGVSASDGGVLAVLLAKDIWTNVAFDRWEPYSNAYEGSNLKSTIGVYETNIANAAKNENGTDWSSIVKKRTLEAGAVSGNSYKSQDNISDSDAVQNATLWPLSAAEATKIKTSSEIFSGADVNFWWLRSPGEDDESAAFVRGESGSSGGVKTGDVQNMLGVRPALCINLTSDIFASGSDDAGYTLTMTEPHNHVWDISISGDGRTATVKCTTDHCPYTTNQEYTVSIAAAGKTYDGTGVTATVKQSGGDTLPFGDGEGLVTIGEIEYAGCDGTNYAESTTAPVNIGKYTASVTVGGETPAKRIKVVYEIAPATVTVTSPMPTTIPTTIPASPEDKLFKDYLHTQALDASCTTIFANGVNTKQKANKTATIYTNVKASYRYRMEKEKLKIETGKVVVGITSKAEKPTLDKKNRIVDAAAAEVASASISHGQIKVTAKKKPGIVWLWVMDTGDEGQSASCPITVKAAPTTLKLRETAESTQDYKKAYVDVGNSMEVYVAPTYKVNNQDVETGDATYSAIVQSGYGDYFDARYEGGKKIKITAKKLKENKSTTAKITVKCDQSGKSVVFTAVGVNRTKTAELSADEGTDFADGTVTLTKSAKENVKGSIKVNTVCVNETVVGTDVKKIYAMPKSGAYDKTKADSGTVSISGKLSSAQKKISAKFSSDGKKIEITAKKGVSGEVYFLVYYNAGCYEEFAVKVS